MGNKHQQYTMVLFQPYYTTVYCTHKFRFKFVLLIFSTIDFFVFFFYLLQYFKYLQLFNKLSTVNSLYKLNILKGKQKLK